jgi:hypothetical protein
MQRPHSGASEIGKHDSERLRQSKSTTIFCDSPPKIWFSASNPLAMLERTDARDKPNKGAWGRYRRVYLKLLRSRRKQWLFVRPQPDLDQAADGVRSEKIPQSGELDDVLSRQDLCVYFFARYPITSGGVRSPCLQPATRIRCRISKRAARILPQRFLRSGAL